MPKKERASCLIIGRDSDSSFSSFTTFIPLPPPPALALIKTGKPISFEIFIASDDYNEISSGNFHDKWFKELESNDYVDKSTKKKINQETIRLLQIQKDTMIKQLMKIPKLYYAKSHFPLELSQRAFDHLWRVCESYELWCKETKQNGLILLNLTE